jgi:hypothetical protein
MSLPRGGDMAAFSAHENFLPMHGLAASGGPTPVLPRLLEKRKKCDSQGGSIRLGA